MSNGIYAQLGTTCNTSMRTLVDNTKFFPLKAPIYKERLTYMYKYPAQDLRFRPVKIQDVEPEYDLVDNELHKKKDRLERQEEQGRRENYEPVSCCRK